MFNAHLDSKNVNPYGFTSNEPKLAGMNMVLEEP